MSTINFDHVYIAMQIFLEKDNHYHGAIDGKVGKKTYEAIEAILDSYGINHKGWSKTRLRVAGEQALYKSLNIEAGAVDGIDDHVMGYARQMFQYRITMMFRDFAEQLWQKGVTKTTPVKTTGKIVPFRQWPTQSRTASYFGKIGENQVSCKLPFPMVIAWQPSKTIRSFSCHKYVQPAFERLFQRTMDHYGYEKIKELRLHYFGGCLNVRKVRGGSTWSQHSWGVAIDLDPENNALKMNHKQATFSKPAYNKFWEFVYDEGFISLGKERDYDWMHFQAPRLG